MAKEKFSWKALFINEEVSENNTVSENKASNAAAEVSAQTRSAGTATKFPDEPVKLNSASSGILNTIIELYESGFESLNKPGYDFYEFFKAIKAVNSNDPQLYKMALSMAQGVDKNVNKARLLEEADYYIEEIEKVHKKYDTQGSEKKGQLQENFKTTKENLTLEISQLEKKLMEIQNLISSKKNEMQSLDMSLQNEISEIEQKIIANNAARTKIMEEILSVVTGIKNNI